MLVLADHGGMFPVGTMLRWYDVYGVVVSRRYMDGVYEVILLESGEVADFQERSVLDRIIMTFAGPVEAPWRYRR